MILSEAIDKYFEESVDKLDDSTLVENLGVLGTGSSNCLTYLTDKKYLKEFLANRDNISALIIRPELKEELGDQRPSWLITSSCPVRDFFLFHTYLDRETDVFKNYAPTSIHSTAIVENGCVISPIGVNIGANSKIGANTVIYQNCRICDNVVVGPNCTIGVDGVQVGCDQSGSRYLVPHLGGVIIQDEAYVGANAVIVKAIFNRNTVIGKGAIIGNLVNIGHEVYVGDEAMVLPMSIVSGSTRVGSRARISPGSTIASSKVIGEDSFVVLGSVVTRDVGNQQKVSGNFAIDHHLNLKNAKKLSEG